MANNLVWTDWLQVAGIDRDWCDAREFKTKIIPFKVGEDNAEALVKELQRDKVMDV